MKDLNDLFEKFNNPSTGNSMFNSSIGFNTSSYFKIINNKQAMNHFGRVIACIEKILQSYFNEVSTFEDEFNCLIEEIEFVKKGKMGSTPIFTVAYGRDLAQWGDRLLQLKQQGNQNVIKELKDQYEKYNYKNELILKIFQEKAIAPVKTHNREKSIFSLLGNDIVTQIFLLLDLRTLGNLARVCTFTRDFVDEKVPDDKWKEYCLQQWDYLYSGEHRRKNEHTDNHKYKIGTEWYNDLLDKNTAPKNFAEALWLKYERTSANEFIPRTLRVSEQVNDKVKKNDSEQDDKPVNYKELVKNTQSYWSQRQSDAKVKNFSNNFRIMQDEIKKQQEGDPVRFRS